jgi:hypothetical protein
MATKKTDAPVEDAPVEVADEAVADEAVEETPVVDEPEAVADEAPEAVEPEAVAAEVTEPVVERLPDFDGWTAQNPAGLPVVTEPERINGITAAQLPVAEEFAKNGGNDDALYLVNKI